VVWLADENFAADREAAREVLERLAERRLGLSLNLNMTAADVVRDADLLPLYRCAGVDNIVLGLESLDDAVVGEVRKNNPLETSRRAVELLRRQGILSLVNIIYGLREETWATLRETFHRLVRLDPDVLNAVYLTPHSWTAAGRAVRPEDVVQPDLERFTYRNQVLAAPRLAPWKLFLGVKLTEALFHLRPRALGRLLRDPDRRFRRLLRAYFWAGARVVAAEAAEFLFRTRFVAPGSLARVPGYPSLGLEPERDRLPRVPQVEDAAVEDRHRPGDAALQDAVHAGRLAVPIGGGLDEHQVARVAQDDQVAVREEQRAVAETRLLPALSPRVELDALEPVLIEAVEVPSGEHRG